MGASTVTRGVEHFKDGHIDMAHHRRSCAPQAASTTETNDKSIILINVCHSVVRYYQNHRNNNSRTAQLQNFVQDVYLIITLNVVIE
jgi:hypothetical protein